MVYEVEEQNLSSEQDCSYKYQSKRQQVEKEEENLVRKTCVFYVFHRVKLVWNLKDINLNIQYHQIYTF